MEKETFYRNNNMSMPIEAFLRNCESYEEFEKEFSDELLNEDCRIGNYLDELLWKYDKKKSLVSLDAGYTHSYVGKIINGQNKEPTRDAILRICLAIGTTLEEAQYLLKYSGNAPLYVRRKRDVIIWFGLMKHEDVYKVDKNLRDRNLEPLVTNI